MPPLTTAGAVFDEYLVDVEEDATSSFFFQFDMRDKNPAVSKKKASMLAIMANCIDKKYL